MSGAPESEESMKRADRLKLNDLLTLYCDDHLSASQHSLLAGMLEREDARQYYLDWMSLHGELAVGNVWVESLDFNHSSLQITQSEPVPSFASAAGLGHPSRLHWWFSRTGIVAALVVFILSFALLRQDTSPALGTIVGQSNAQWKGGPKSVGDPIGAGVLELASGEAELLMQCHAAMTLHGPVTIEVRDAKAIKLLSGRVSLNVPDEGIGFRVLTPSADLVDMGTTFSVDVVDRHQTELHVAKGTVVARSMQADVVVPFYALEAARIGLGDFSEIDFIPEIFPNQFLDEERVDELPVGAPIPLDSRIVFLGDRWTDRESHLLLFRQALTDAGIDHQIQLFNLGVAFPLSFTEQHFRDCVESVRPTHAVLEFGSEVALERPARTPQNFETDIRALIDRLEVAGIEPILETTILGPSIAHEDRSRLSQYNEILRRLAQELNLRLVDFANRYKASESSGRSLLAPEGVWVTFAGYQELTRSLLAQFGFANVVVPNHLRVTLLPGIVKSWRYRFKDSKDWLNADEVRDLEVNEDWKTLELPQPQGPYAERLSDSNLASFRAREQGFATGLWSVPGWGLIAKASLHSPDSRRAYINTGGTLFSVWFNGRQVYSRGRKVWTGWHAGRERIEIQLRPGDNDIVIEADNSFFVSVTDQPDWSL
ncbi:FecR domain-containing protein [Neorhodopirellula pilleata]|uniref:FecR protein n=1 Tax=Neorhodopirellula pilleata TaxID=2714738 RepID=A0A5C6A8M4_9BACT|nr:FecR domain-containing protein [Neorhodopirellula pilleata]TWT96314.1 FecR protein [Neorhodopirellula pilleata]